MLLTDPDQSVEQSIFIKHLPGSEPVHVAVFAIEGFRAFVGHLISPQRVLGQHERLHLAQISEVFVGQSNALQLGVRLADEFLDALAVRREQDVPHLPVQAASLPPGVHLMELERAAVGVVVALLFEPAPLVGELLDKGLRRLLRCCVSDETGR